MTLNKKRAKKARALLNKYKQGLRLEPQLAEHFAELKRRLIQQDLEEAINQLEIILKNQNPLDAFKKICSLRAKELKQYSSLGFAEMNQSDCNRLFWEMTTLLLETTTMSQQLAVLMPHIREIITPFVTRIDAAKPWSRRNLCVTLEKKPIESLT